MILVAALFLIFTAAVEIGKEEHRINNTPQKHPRQRQIELVITSLYTWGQMNTYAYARNMHADAAFRHLVMLQCQREGVPFLELLCSYATSQTPREPLVPGIEESDILAESFMAGQSA